MSRAAQHYTLTHLPDISTPTAASISVHAKSLPRVLNGVSARWCVEQRTCTISMHLTSHQNIIIVFINPTFGVRAGEGSGEGTYLTLVVS